MKIFRSASMLLLLMVTNHASADPDDSIFTTYSENGERQIDFRMGAINQSGQATQSASTVGYGYGVTDYWFSELYIGYVRSGSGGTDFDSAALQNTFRLTDEQSPVEIGLYTEIEYEADRTAGYQLTFGPLLQGDIGLTRLNFNLLFQRNYLADFPNPLQLGYQWQIKHHWNFPVDFGLQGFGEFGQWNHWAPRDEQSHRLGPGIFGKVSLGEHRVINYNAAILFDAFDQQHATTFRTQVVYGF
ncbi:MAG TPA: hypothetical protein VK832_01390 [Burkholderiaceae bacterium]|jgi:hypothetical protein|nr:hypothetical protein [Burkholderiaceae bacterium]